MSLVTQFLLVNAHFTLNLLVALVCFAVSWLYFDAWLGRHDRREGTKSAGFLLISLAFVLHATHIESAAITTSVLAGDAIGTVSEVLRILGYVVLIAGQLIDPLQPLPDYRKAREGFGIHKKAQPVQTGAAILLSSIPLPELLLFANPLSAVITGILYLRRATVGLEHHLKPISRSFLILGIAEAVHLAGTFRGTGNVTLEGIVAPFGLVWAIEHVFLIFFMFTLGSWVWGYLIKRLETQLLMIFTTLTLIIFLITTVFFTTTSLGNLRQTTLSSLKINVNVLQFTLDSKRGETLSDAQVIAQNSGIIQAVSSGERKTILDLATPILLTKKQSYLVITGKDGEILVRADDPEKSSGSLSSDALVARALRGEAASSVVVKDGPMAPEVSVRAAAPVRTGGEVVGSVVMGTLIDSAFVDGLKSATGLDASVYGDNIRAATTFIAADGKSRWVGIKEETEGVKKDVLVDGHDFVGSVNILNVPYYAAFTPLKDVDDNPVGMLFVGTPQVSLLQAAGESIGLTFVVTAGLLILSVIPAYFVSKFIIDQIR